MSILKFTEDFIRDREKGGDSIGPSKVWLRILSTQLKLNGYGLVKPDKQIDFSDPYHPKKIPVDFDQPDKLFYKYDGYGQLKRFFDDNFEYDKNSRVKVFFGTARDIPKKHKDEIHIMFTMFECDLIPEAWVTKFNHFDAIITPSEFSRQAFVRSGVTIPIYRVPLFSKYFNIVAPSPHPFTFGHENAFITGGQKGWDLVIEAFEQLFNDFPDNQVRLLLKARKSHLWASDHAWMERCEKNPKIKIILDDYTDWKMVTSFYGKLNCFVYPSRGEGFGLPPLQAIGHGIPTILTNGHSHAEFVDLGIPVGVIGKATPYYVGRVNDSVRGSWVEPSLDDVKRLMLDVYQNYSKRKEEAVSRVPEAKYRYSSEMFVTNLINAVNEIKQEKGLTSKSLPVKSNAKSILWVNDYIGYGGAEMTNDTLIKACPYPIKFVLSKNFRPEMAKGRLVILNGIYQLERGYLEHVINSCDYMYFDHDYGFCERRDSRHTTHTSQSKCDCVGRRAAIQRLHDNAKLSILMSPMHLAEQSQFVSFKNTFICPSAIDVYKIKNTSKKRHHNDVVFLTKSPHKGSLAALRQCVGDVYCIHAGTEYTRVINMMKDSKTFVYTPEWVEPCGRIVMEAVLAGCKVVTNGRVGATSFENWNDPVKLRKMLKQVPGKFWKKVGEYL